MVPARPAFIGSDGWVRSKAWHWVFSSKLNTIARAGGFTYSPTTSTSLASKCGSLLTLNVSTRHGFKLWSAQIVATASLPIPTRAARVRVLHCVDPSAGRSLCVSRNTSSTMPGGRLDLRPRPLAITPTPPVPCSANRERHRRTVSESTSQRRAISSLATPSLAHNSPRACITCRCGNDVDAAIRSNSARWASLTGNAAAVITGILQNTVLIHRQTTRGSPGQRHGPSPLSSPGCSSSQEDLRDTFPSSSSGSVDWYSRRVAVLYGSRRSRLGCLPHMDQFARNVGILAGQCHYCHHPVPSCRGRTGHGQTSQDTGPHRAAGVRCPDPLGRFCGRGPRYGVGL